MRGLILLDAAGTLRAVSAGFPRLLGWPSDAVRPGMTACELACACEAAGLPRDLLVDIGGSLGDETCSVLERAGGPALACWRERLPDGSLVLGFQDVTDRRAERAQASRKAELRASLENAAVGVIDVECGSGLLIRANPAFCEMGGWSEADLIGGLTHAALIHPDDRAQCDELWSTLCATGRAYHAEMRYVRANGAVVWVRVGASASASDEAGRPVRAMMICTDVTAGKNAEAALRANQELLRMSLDIGGIASFRMDHRAGVIHVGPESRDLHGFDAGEAPIPVATWAATWLPEDRERMAAELARTYAERRPVASFEYRFRHPVLGIRHMETRARIQYDEAGRPNGSVGVGIDVTERRQAQERIAHLAHHDALTDLPNRVLFRIRLEEALARAQRGEPFAICCLDLDHFKDVNDTLGHSIGDALLQAAAERLKAALRPADTVARLGGDEFAIIQTSLDQPANATALAERVIASLAAPFEIEGHQVVVGTSVGIALSSEDGLDPDELLRNADLAMYGAKADGRGRYRFFEPEMNQRMQTRRILQLDLRRALEAEEFELMYQPLISVPTRALCGFEALLRWRHPTRGLVAPDRFIPHAEATGLIVPIGAWVLRTACAEAAGWPGAPRVAVNLSAVQFSCDDLVETVTAALRDSGLHPSRLELEITESAMLQGSEATLDTLHRLKSLGVGIAMDDFGTGYSSLSYLQRFPFDRVKIDRSFVANLGNTRESGAIVSAVIDLCAGLDMSTTAEGIEAESQLAALAGTGCAEAQGFHISPPRRASEIPGLIAWLAPGARVAEPVALQ